jgi:hypothetical protein
VSDGHLAAPAALPLPLLPQLSIINTKAQARTKRTN